MPVYLTVSSACKVLGIHRNTLYKCIKMGAPAHRWGPSGRQYRIIVSEFISWMDNHGEKHTLHAETPAATETAEDMAQRRRELLHVLTA